MKNKRNLTFGLILVSLTCWGQTDEFKTKESKQISKHDFDSLVDNSITTLETKDLRNITDGEHVNIMYCLNTIFVLSIKDKEYKGGHYKKLETLAEKVKYTDNIVKIYSDWTPNRGMGYYFPKLKMELYGTPMPYAVWDVKR